jgi:hydroxymethylbilane synthase
MLRALRPDLRIQPLRGNLDTRLRKLDEGQYDAIVLAAAGLKRLGLASRIRDVFDAEAMLPAAGQGALGLEIRDDDDALGSMLQALVHRPTWLAVHAERAVSRALGGSCSLPLAAHGRWIGEQLQLSAALGHPGNPSAPLLRVTLEGPVAQAEAAEAMGRQAAQALVQQGGSAYLQAAAHGA